jgi:chaperonin cofactor prefoldin
MSQTLINTLRFADRLKEAGFAGAQAEALARVLGDELTEQLPSKADFQTLQADFKTLEAKFDGLEGRFDGLEGRLDVLERKFDTLQADFKTLEAKFDGLRYTLNLVLVLVGLLVALGLIEPLSKLLGS